MNKSISSLVTIALLAPCLPLTTNAATGPCAAAPQVYDLKADWSDTANPNGTWSYRMSDTLLLNNPFPWVGAGYTGCSGGCGWPPSVTAIEKVAGAVKAYSPLVSPYPGALEDGDVLVVPGNGGSIRWTASESGTINISGSIWEADTFYLC